MVTVTLVYRIIDGYKIRNEVSDLSQAPLEKVFTAQAVQAVFQEDLGYALDQAKEVVNIFARALFKNLCFFGEVLSKFWPTHTLSYFYS